MPATPLASLLATRPVLHVTRGFDRMPSLRVEPTVALLSPREQTIKLIDEALAILDDDSEGMFDWGPPQETFGNLQQ